MIPSPVVQEYGRFIVVRDDLLLGGTKRRAIDVILPLADEFVYASPAQGYAQMALAYACRSAGKQATIFVAKRNELHHRTVEAKQAGAKIVQVPFGYLSNVQAKARAYCEKLGAYYVPFGMEDPLFMNALAGVARRLQIQPREVWTVAGSGTLTRSLQLAWPTARFIAVQIGKPPNVGRAELLIAPERYEDSARMPPPFPSCSNYDAKAWRFMKERASDGALFWNVGA